MEEQIRLTKLAFNSQLKEIIRGNGIIVDVFDAEDDQEGSQINKYLCLVRTPVKDDFTWLSQDELDFYRVKAGG